MVGAWKRARKDPYLASEALLALNGITEPTKEQRVGAMIEAEFKLKVIAFLSPKG